MGADKKICDENGNQRGPSPTAAKVWQSLVASDSDSVPLIYKQIQNLDFIMLDSSY